MEMYRNWAFDGILIAFARKLIKLIIEPSVVYFIIYLNGACYRLCGMLKTIKNSFND